MKKIIFACHCLLNIAAKVEMDDFAAMEEEEKLRRRLIGEAVDSGIQIIQLPCPEFMMYGSRRWGHTSNQFDNPFFREESRKLLYPYILQCKEYMSDRKRFKVLGFIGIDGSPSCGVKYTGIGNWGGSYSADRWKETVKEHRPARKSGIFIRVLRELLREHNISVPVVGLYAEEEERVFELIRDKNG